MPLIIINKCQVCFIKKIIIQMMSYCIMLVEFQGSNFKYFNISNYVISSASCPCSLNKSLLIYKYTNGITFKFKRVVMTLHNDRFLVQKHFVSCGNEQFLIYQVVNDTFLAVTTSSY